jgi:hypothetical protein
LDPISLIVAALPAAETRRQRRLAFVLSLTWPTAKLARSPRCWLDLDRPKDYKELTPS